MPHTGLLYEEELIGEGLSLAMTAKREAVLRIEHARDVELSRDTLRKMLDYLAKQGVIKQDGPAYLVVDRR